MGRIVFTSSQFITKLEEVNGKLVPVERTEPLRNAELAQFGHLPTRGERRKALLAMKKYLKKQAKKQNGLGR